MRIIAGEYKSRNLVAPDDERVRPTTAKVREAIYSMLMNDIYDAVIADLFAGTGTLGLEGLSRGAAKCYFADNSRDSLKMIKQNIGICRAEAKSVVIAGSYEKAISMIHDKCDILLLDPPYRDGLYVKAVELAVEMDILAEDAVIVCEHLKSEELPQNISRFEKIKTRRYGQIAVSIYR